MSYLKSINWCFAVALAMTLFLGCGGGRSSEPTGTVTDIPVRVVWESRTRAVTRFASSARITLPGARTNGENAVVVVNRAANEPSGGAQGAEPSAAYEQEFTVPGIIKKASYRVLVEGFSGAEARGVKVFSQHVATVRVDGTGPVVLNPYAESNAFTISKIEPVTVKVGAFARLSARIQGEGGSLPVASDQLTAIPSSGGDPGNAVALTNQGTILGLRPGTTTFKIGIEGSPFQDVAVTVVANPEAVELKPAADASLAETLAYCRANQLPVTDIALGHTDAWVVVVAERFYAARDIPDDLRAALANAVTAGKKISKVALGGESIWGLVLNGTETDFSRAFRNLADSNRSVRYFLQDMADTTTTGAKLTGLTFATDGTPYYLTSRFGGWYTPYEVDTALFRGAQFLYRTAVAASGANETFVVAGDTLADTGLFRNYNQQGIASELIPVLDAYTAGTISLPLLTLGKPGSFACIIVEGQKTTFQGKATR